MTARLQTSVGLVFSPAMLQVLLINKRRDGRIKPVWTVFGGLIGSNRLPAESVVKSLQQETGLKSKISHWIHAADIEIGRALSVSLMYTQQIGLDQKALETGPAKLLRVCEASRHGSDIDTHLQLYLALCCDHVVWKNRYGTTIKYDVTSR